LAVAVRLKEITIAPFVHHFFLAEKCYETEMKFFKNRYTVLENKSTLPPTFKRLKVTRELNLIFTGTISESTGVFEAILLTENLYAKDHSVRLKIVGHCAQKSTLKKLKSTIKDKPYISLIGGDSLVPHSEILAQIAEADFGIIYYSPSPHTAQKVPTKLFEYLQANLPILLQNNPEWVAMCTPFNACIPVNFQTIPATELLQKMSSEKFYTSPVYGANWQSEEVKLKTALGKYLI
jgi:hypothetical protein